MVKHVPTRKSAKMRYWLQVRPDPLHTSPLCVLSIMLRKEYYQVPAADVISLTSIKETMQSSSATGSGSNMSDPNIISGEWNDLFTE